MSWYITELPVYRSYDELPTPLVGKIAQIPRLCGNGYFALRGNGTRWEVCPGESIVRDAGVDSAGYDLTATGTAYVPLASYTIPAGLIGNGEEWEYDYHCKAGAVHNSGNDIPDIKIATSSIKGSTPILSSVNSVCRGRGAFVRIGSVLTCRSSAVTGELYSSNVNSDVSLDLSVTRTIEIGIAPGAVGNIATVRQWTFRRIG